MSKEDWIRSYEDARARGLSQGDAIKEATTQPAIVLAIEPIPDIEDTQDYGDHD